MRQWLVCLAMVLMLRVLYMNPDATGSWGTVLATQLTLNGCFMVVRTDCCPDIKVIKCGTVSISRWEEVEANK